MNISLRKSVFLVILSLGAMFGQAAGKLNIYNWNDYVGDTTQADFERLHGTKVKYDMYDSNETLQAKLLTGKSGYDIVVPSLEFAAKQIQSGIYLPLDKSKLSNYANLDPQLLKKIEVADPGNKYLVPYLWGTTAFAINVDKVKAALAGLPMPQDEWELLFNPKYTNKLKSCGISLMDMGSELYPMLNIYQGRKMDDYSEEALKAGNAVLKTVRADIRMFNSSPIDILANGDVCVAMAFNGDSYIAKDRAVEAKNGQKIEYIVPKKGTEMWIDSMAIPKDAKNIDNALKWINHILDGKVVAQISNKVNYANPNLKATALVDKKLTSDPRVYFDAAAMSRLQAKRPLSSEEQKRMVKYFNQFKAAK